VTGWSRGSGSADRYSAWIPFCAAAAYAYRGGQIVGEIDGETIADRPFSNQIVTPVGWLAG